MGDGAGGRPEPESEPRIERRLGYRPPPRSWGVRLLILCVVVVLTAVLLKAVVDLLVAYAGQAGEIGQATQRPRPAAAAAR